MHTRTGARGRRRRRGSGSMGSRAVSTVASPLLYDVRVVYLLGNYLDR